MYSFYFEMRTGRRKRFAAVGSSVETNLSEILSSLVFYRLKLFKSTDRDSATCRIFVHRGRLHTRSQKRKRSGD